MIWTQMLATIATLFILAQSAQAQCTSPQVRMDWMQLTKAEKDLYISCVQKLMTQRDHNTATTPQSLDTSVATDPNVMSFYDLVDLHVDVASWVHGSADFYPFHRTLVWKFEQAMQSVGWVGAVPYWDWLSVYDKWWDPAVSDVFSNNYFGPATSSDTTNYCVTDGPFSASNYQVVPCVNCGVTVSTGANDRPDLEIHNNANCLRRCGSIGTPAYDPSVQFSRYSATSYNAFRGDTSDTDETAVELMHAPGHTLMGGICGDNKIGDMAHSMISPNDPLFWLHHGLVDKIWWRWQTRCKAFTSDYEGPLQPYDLQVDPTQTRQATSSQLIDVWGSTGLTVAQILNTQGGTLCYTYSNSLGDQPMPPITCPAFNGVADPGVNPDPTVYVPGNPLAGIPGATPLSTAGVTTVTTTAVPASNNPALDQFLQGIVSMAILTVKEGKPVVFGRRDDDEIAATEANNNSVASSTLQNYAGFSSMNPQASLHYSSTTNKDNSTTITLLEANQTFVIPASHTIRHIARSYIETVDAQGKLERQHIYLESKPYIPIIRNSSTTCDKKHPPALPDWWIDMHKLNRIKIRNSEARAWEKIDQWNTEHC